MTNASGRVLDIDFAEKSGAVAGDASRYGNDGALNGCKWVENGLEFNGSSDYVDCGNDASLDITDAITISTWIKPSHVAAAHYYIGYNTTNGLYIDATKAHFRVDGTTAEVLFSFSVYNWYCIVWTRTGTTYNCYINSNYIGVFTGSSANVPIKYIGSRGTLGTYPWKGIIDDVRIRSRALNASEIKAEYDSTKHKYM